MPIATGSRFGPYEVLAPLGAGGMGEVYRARDTRLGREVAVKVLPEAFAADGDRLRRFEQEARAAGSLNHPNILVLHDVGTHEGTPYLVTELLEGETLRARIREGALSPRKAIDYAQGIARGLAAGHQRGLVHRDLKPENIFILPDGRAKILDFGIAKLTRPDAAPGAAASAAGATAGPTRTATPASVDTDPGVVMGSAGYMAPEQVRGLPVDHRTDIFALGAILYEMLTGRRAFQGGTAAETMTAILREEPPDLERDGRPLPPALDRIVRHCLEKSPTERFQSASDVAFALQALSGISDSGPKPAVVGVRARSWRRMLASAIVGVLLVTAGVLAGRQLPGSRGVSEITYRRLTFRRGEIYAARFSTDGRTVSYGAAFDGSKPAIFSIDLNTPGSLLNVEAPDSAIFLAISRLNEMVILIRPRPLPHGLWRGTLARMTPGGAPRELVDGVLDADWSPDGSRLAVVHFVNNRYRVEYPVGTVLYESPGWISHLRISPDGKKVAYFEHPVFPDDRGSVMVAEAPGHARTVGPVFTSAQGLAWSRKGEEVWFAAATRGAARSIYAVNLAGRSRMVASLPNGGRIHDISETGETLITTDNVSVGTMARAPGEKTERDLTWFDWTVPAAISRDDRTLLFSEDGDGGGDHYSVCIRGVNGSAPIRLGEGNAEDLSPDGKWALAVRFWTKPPELILLPTGVGEPRTLPATGFENIVDARFFPSGTRLLLIGNEPGRGVRAYVRDIAGGAIRPVTPEGAQVRSGVLSPDERWVVGILPGGEVRLYAIEGGTPRNVMGILPGEVVLGWASDSKSIYVATPGSRPRKVVRLDLASGKRSSWAELTGPEDRAGVVLGYMTLGHDDHSYAYTYARILSELFLARGMR